MTISKTTMTSLSSELLPEYRLQEVAKIITDTYQAVMADLPKYMKASKGNHIAVTMTAYTYVGRGE